MSDPIVPEPYRVELALAPAVGEGVRAGLFEVRLADRMRQGVFVPGDALLDATEGWPVRDFLQRFHAGERPPPGDALAFGRRLRELLFERTELRDLWKEIGVLRGNRPLHLTVVVPSGAGAKVAELPLELLADDSGFLFRQPGSALVRAVEKMTARPAELTPGERALVIWSNPTTTPSGASTTLPDELFATHEEALAALASGLGLEALEPCRRATFRGLAQRLEQGRPVALVSLVAHGGGSGGLLLLHAEGPGGEALEQGTLARARDVARELRLAGAKVAFVWSCHGACRHEDAGALAEALLDPRYGDLAAVVAAHAAVQESAMRAVARKILEALRGVAEGDLGRAVAEARCALPERDVQWAAPVYYARPLQGRDVSVPSIVAHVAAPPPQGLALDGAPAPSRHFVGRSREVGQGLELLRQHRFVTIRGFPGSGKTELALAVAGRALGDPDLRPDRGLWLPLQGAPGAAWLRGRLALALDIERAEDDEELARKIGNRRLLLVLDNAEDLVASDHLGFQALLATLFRLCRGVRVLATSRRAIGDAGEPEEELPVGRLDPPADRELFTAVAGPRLEPSAATSADLAALVEMLDGHAQSLVLVAGRVGHGESLAALHRRLEHEREAAVVAHEIEAATLAGSPDERLRAKSLAASLNLSYRPLAAADPGAAEAFAWLGALPAGLPSAFVEAVFGEEGERMIATLLRQNLAEIRGDERRLALPGPIRWYALGRLAEIPLERRRALLAATWNIEAAWWAGAYQEVKGLRAPRAKALALTEEPNLVGLLGLLTADGGDTETASRAADTVAWWALVASHAGRPSAALERCEQAAQVTSSATDKPAADLRRTLGDLYVRTDRLRDAEHSYFQALAIYRTIGDRLGEANSLLAFGDLYLRADHLRDAEDRYLRALPIYRAIEDRVGEANTLKALGDLYLRTDRLRDAEDSYLDALPLCHATQDLLGEANLLKALGDLYVRTDRLRDGMDQYLQALPIYSATEDRLGEANSLLALGNLYLRMNRLHNAESSYLQALSIYRSIEVRLGEANSLVALGDLYLRLDRVRDAEDRYLQGLAIYRAIDNRLGEANSVLALGHLYVRTDRLRDAEDNHLHALSIYRTIENRLGEANALLGLGFLALARNEQQAAFGHFLGALAAHRQIEDRFSEAGDHGYLARAALAAGQPGRAAVLAARAWRLLREIEDSFGQRLALDELVTAFGELEEHEAEFAAFVLAWRLAVAIDDPSAPARTEALRQAIPDADPAQAPSEEEVQALEQAVEAAVAGQEEALRAAGEDPYSPLTAP